MKLEYIVTSTFGFHGTKISRISQSQAYQLISEDAIFNARRSCFITTVVGWWLPRIPRAHMAIIECSDNNNMLVAAHYLKMSNIGYCPIKYSDVPGQVGDIGYTGHDVQYIIVTDVVGTYDEAIGFTRRVPGQYKSKFVEVDPKPHRSDRIRIPTQIGKVTPQFPNDTYTLTNKRSIAWYNAFKQHWESDAIMKALLARKLATAIKDKTIDTIVSDPKFIV